MKTISYEVIPVKKKYDLSKFKLAKNRKNPKVQKSFHLDPEVLLWLEEQGEKRGMEYQTFLNWHLRQQMLEDSTVDERLKRIEAEIFKKRIA